MPLTLLDVVDSAVKIGLGALISGLATWRVTKMTHAHELEKLRIASSNAAADRRAGHRETVLEAVATEVESFTHVALRYWALMSEWVRRRDNGTSMSDARRTELDQSAAELFNGYKELTSAEAKLLLLGEKEAQRILRAYGERTVRFRGIAYTGSTEVTLAQMEEARADMLRLREQLFDVLSTRYDGATTTTAVALSTAEQEAVPPRSQPFG